MFAAIQHHVLVAGLVDLDGSILVMLALFLAFFAVVQGWVVKPLVRAQELRHSRMEGARRDAETMDLRAAEDQARYAAELAQARAAAVADRDVLASDGKERAHRLVSGVRAEVERDASEQLGELEAQAEAGRRQVDAQADQLAELIATRFVGVRR